MPVILDTDFPPPPRFYRDRRFTPADSAPDSEPIAHKTTAGKPMSMDEFKRFTTVDSEPAESFTCFQLIPPQLVPPVGVPSGNWQEASNTFLPALNTPLLWPMGKVISVGFIEPVPVELGKKIARFAQEWCRHGHVQFAFLTEQPWASPPDVRIKLISSFKAFSFIGRSCLVYDGPNDPTLLLPNFKDNASLRSAVLHLFGHVLGAVHEHMAPFAKIRWSMNMERIIYPAPEGFFAKLAFDTLYSGGLRYKAFDKHSIMTFNVDPLYSNLVPYIPETNNTTLSDWDMRWAAKAYPPKNVTSSAPEDTGDVPAQKTQLRGATDDEYHAYKFPKRPANASDTAGIPQTSNHDGFWSGKFPNHPRSAEQSGLDRRITTPRDGDQSLLHQTIWNYLDDTLGIGRESHRSPQPDRDRFPSKSIRQPGTTKPAYYEPSEPQAPFSIDSLANWLTMQSFDDRDPPRQPRGTAMLWRKSDDLFTAPVTAKDYAAARSKFFNASAQALAKVPLGDILRLMQAFSEPHNDEVYELGSVTVGDMMLVLNALFAQASSPPEDEEDESGAGPGPGPTDGAEDPGDLPGDKNNDAGDPAGPTKEPPGPSDNLVNDDGGHTGSAGKETAEKEAADKAAAEKGAADKTAAQNEAAEKAAAAAEKAAIEKAAAEKEAARLAAEKAAAEKAAAEREAARLAALKAFPYDISQLDWPEERRYIKPKTDRLAAAIYGLNRLKLPAGVQQHAGTTHYEEGNGFYATLMNPGGTTTAGMTGAFYLQFPHNGEDNMKAWNQWFDKGATSVKTTFNASDRQYDKPPIVVPFITGFTFPQTPEPKDYRMRTWVTDVRTDSFVLNVAPIGDCPFLWGAASWIAYPSDSPGVQSSISMVCWDARHEDGFVTFANCEYEEPPIVAIGWNLIDFPGDQAISLETKVESVTTTGFKYKIDSNAAKAVNRIEFSWIAVGKLKKKLSPSQALSVPQLSYGTNNNLAFNNTPPNSVKLDSSESCMVLAGLQSVQIISSGDPHISSYPYWTTSDTFQHYISFEGNPKDGDDSAQAFWLRILKRSWADVQGGVWNFSENGPSTTRISFNRPFDVPPTVVAFISGFTFGSDKDHAMKAYATDVSNAGFTLVAEGIGNTNLKARSASWLAIAKGAYGITTMQYSISAMQYTVPSSDPKQPSYQPRMFLDEYEEPPQVIYGLSLFTVARQSIKVGAVVNDVTTKGFRVTNVGLEPGDKFSRLEGNMVVVGRPKKT